MKILCCFDCAHKDPLSLVFHTPRLQINVVNTVLNGGLTKKKWRLHNSGNTTGATTLLQQFIRKTYYLVLQKSKKKNEVFFGFLPTGQLRKKYAIWGRRETPTAGSFFSLTAAKKISLCTQEKESETALPFP